MKLPNLELIEYIAKEIIKNTENFKAVKQKEDILEPSLTFEVFRQTWNNSTTGFVSDEYGNPYKPDYVVTREYTTIVRQ